MMADIGDCPMGIATCSANQPPTARPTYTAATEHAQTAMPALTAPNAPCRATEKYWPTSSTATVEKVNAMASEAICVTTDTATYGAEGLKLMSPNTCPAMTIDNARKPTKRVVNTLVSAVSGPFRLM